MVGMTAQERLDDICKLSGLSEEIVRRVQDAERQSIVKSLRKGERATLLGRCVIRPEIRSKLEINGRRVEYIKCVANTASSLEAALRDLSGFEVEHSSEDYDMPKGILTTQIADLV